jgi:hypothetical protein
MKKLLCIVTALFTLSWASAQTGSSADQSSSTDQSMHKGMQMHKGGAGEITGCLTAGGPQGLIFCNTGPKRSTLAEMMISASMLATR